MSAPLRSSGSPEAQAELDALRSRAYGPDADIDRDADALARLVELEEQLRSGAAPDEAVELGVRQAVDPEVPVPDGAVVTVTPDGSASDVRRRGLRRVPVLVWVLLALALGATGGFLLPFVGAPQPVTTLERAPLGDAPVDFELYGVSAESPVRYEPYHDLQIWSGITEQGSTCIVITNDAGEWIAAGCAPEPLHPVADVIFFPGMRQIEGLDLPDGSVLRFTLRDDVMEVWVAETVGDAQSSAATSSATASAPSSAYGGSSSL